MRWVAIVLVSGGVFVLALVHLALCLESGSGWLELGFSLILVGLAACWFIDSTDFVEGPVSDEDDGGQVRHG